MKDTSDGPTKKTPFVQAWTLKSINIQIKLANIFGGFFWKKIWTVWMQE